MSNENDPSDSEVLRLLQDAYQQNHIESLSLLVQLGYPINSHIDSRFGEEISGYTPLHLAIKNKNRTVVISFLKTGADITEKSANSWTPIHLAFYYSYHDLILTIFQHSKINTYVNAVDNTGLTHFHICCALSVPAVIEKFITNGVEVNCPVPSLADEYSGFTPLHFAVKYKNKDALIYLLQQGADITKKSANSQTPVHLAFYDLDRDSISTIFEHSQINTYINAIDNTGLTHFHICCALGIPTFVIQSFITNGTNVNCSVSVLADKNSGFTPLHFAVQNGHTSTAKLLLENRANLQMKCGRGFTPLHVACERSELPNAELLLTYDHYLTALMTKDNRGFIPLHVACKNRNLSVVELLLTYDAGLNSLKTKDKEDRTALHHAAEQGSVSIVKFLMEKGASIRKPDNKNQTPFDVAVKSRQYGVVEVMLPQCKNEDGTPISFSTIFNSDDFHDACRQGNLKDTKRFLKYGFSVNSQTGSNAEKQFHGYTALHYAVENDCLNVVIKLLRKGADITIKNDHGCTPVHLAYQKKFNHHILHIFKHSKNNTYVDVANESGLSHFHICCTLNAWGIIEDFIKHGVDVNIQTLSLSNSTESGFTPLHYAIRSGPPSNITLLLKNGADPSLSCTDGSTPLHLLCEYDDNPGIQFGISQLLLEFGADLMTRDYQNRLPLHRAFYTNPDTPLTGFLLEKIPKDYNYADDQRLSVLHIACFRRKPDIVKRLLDQGCCPNDRVTLNKRYSNLIFAKDKLISGVTPLHIALYVKDETIAEQLLLAGADINARDDNGNSTLIYFCMYRSLLWKEVITDHNNSWTMSINNTNSQMEVLIVSHVQKLEAAEAYVSAEIKQKVTKSNILTKAYYKRRFNLDACITELEKIQSIKIDGCADGILRSILKKNDTEMSRVVENENLITFLSPECLDILVKEFPLYGCMIKAQINKGLRRAERVRKAKDSLKSLTGISLPDHCSELILEHLSTEHIENLIHANVFL